jgi:hypothetical protein
MLRTSLYKYQNSNIKDTQEKGAVSLFGRKDPGGARFSSLFIILKVLNN